MASSDDIISQDEIEQLLKQAQSAAAPAKPAAPAPKADPAALIDQSEIEALLGKKAKPAAAVATTPPPAQPAGQQRNIGDDINFLLAQAEAAIASVDRPASQQLDGLAPFQLRDFGGAPASSEKATLELLRDVELDVKIELGRAEMPLEDVLRLRKGSVVPLDKLAGDPVDVYVNGRLIARGEVLVLNDNFCVRVAELLTGEEQKAA